MYRYSKWSLQSPLCNLQKLPCTGAYILTAYAVAYLQRAKAIFCKRNMYVYAIIVLQSRDVQ